MSTSLDIQTLDENLIEIWKNEEKLNCENSYESFVKSAWHVLEPENDLEWNWHHSVICENIQNRIHMVGQKIPYETNLLINVPPSTLKSTLVTIMPNAWAWIHYPWMRFLTVSYSGNLAERHAFKTRTIIGSEWYQQYWGNQVIISKRQDAKTLFETTVGGMRLVGGVGGTVTGNHADIISEDDLLSAKQAKSDVETQNAVEFHVRTMKTRKRNFRITQYWHTAQRLREDDVPGYIINNEKRVELLCFPGEDCDWVEPIKYRSKYVNGLLIPNRYTRKILDEIKTEDSFMHAGQIMQRPAPEEGGIFKRTNWRFWVPRGVDLAPYKIRIGMEDFICESVELPLSFDDVINTWDFTFKDKVKNDFVSGHCIGSSGANFYFLDEFHKKVDFSGSCSAMVSMKEKWPLTSQILVEDKANGSAIISEFQSLITGIIAVPSHGAENTRIKANVVSKIQTTGNVILPHPNLPGMGWVLDFIDEYAIYDNGTYDDRVSSGCQGVCHLKSAKPIFPMFQNKKANVKIDWLTLKDHMIPYISQWVEKDISTSIIVAVWDSLLGRMAIIDEFVVNTAMPEVITYALKHKIIRATRGVVKDLKRFEWIGNGLMFSRADRGVNRTNLIREGMWDQYERVGVSVNDNVTYDEHGSILILGKMFTLNTIVIDQKAPETSRQLASWCYEGNEPAKYGFGCARSLCNLVSIINETGSIIKTRKKLKQYSPQRDLVQQRVEQLDMENRLDDFIKNGMEVSNLHTSNVSSENRWMVGG